MCVGASSGMAVATQKAQSSQAACLGRVGLATQGPNSLSHQPKSRHRVSPSLGHPKVESPKEPIVKRIPENLPGSTGSLALGRAICRRVLLTLKQAASRRNRSRHVELSVSFLSIIVPGHLKQTRRITASSDLESLTR
jgi:hypothetical protein